MRMILAAAVLIAAPIAVGAAHHTALAAAPNDIIWDPPKTATAPSKETLTPIAPTQGPTSQDPSAQEAPDKNGIIWDAPPSSSARATPPPSSASAKPDGNGIVWNAPPVKPSGPPPSSALLTPPSGPSSAGPSSRRVAQAPLVTDGPCREFQTTIVIDGKREPAHGTVCQQPDGTWRVVNK